MLNRTADLHNYKKIPNGLLAVRENSENVRSEVRNFVVDIQRHLERGNNDVDGLDYIILYSDLIG